MYNVAASAISGVSFIDARNANSEMFALAQSLSKLPFIRFNIRIKIIEMCFANEAQRFAFISELH